MHRTSREIERKIIDLHFQGYSRDVIAAMVGVPPSTVSEVLKLLPERLTDLRELSVELKKHNLSVFDAKKGTELQARLADLGVGFEKMQNFVESAEKTRTNPDYDPKMVVEAAMKLSNLEKECGKTYCEALLDFEEKKDKTKTLETKERELTERVDTLETEKKRKLAENNVTEKELAYIVDLRRDFHKYGVNLSDGAGLWKYLKNMRETGGDPKKFVEYTKKHDSLEKNIAFLEQKERQKTLNVQGLQKEEQNAEKTIDVLNSTKSELDKLISEKRKTKAALEEETGRTEEEKNQKLATLALLLEVEATAEKVIDALGNKQKELEKINAGILQEQNRLQNLRQHVQELENRINILEREIQDKVGIDNYVTQLKTGIAALEKQKLALEKEANEKLARIAAADTITNFLLRSPYDFGQFCLHVEMLKTMKSETSQPALYIAITEEKIRDIALRAFEGHLMTKKEQTELLIEQEKQKQTIAKLKTETEELEVGLEETNKKLGSANNTIRLLEAIKLNFEGRSITLGELKNWVLSIFNEEIQRRTDLKLDMYATAASWSFGFCLQKNHA